MTPERRRAAGARARAWKYAKKYGVPIEWYEKTLAAQDGRCAGCGDPPRLRRLAVDHDHATGRARGLLCTGCNQGLGLFGDDVELLRRAIEYLDAQSAVNHFGYAAGSDIHRVKSGKPPRGKLVGPG